MPETQIRRPDGSNTTIPELLQELAGKEAAEAKLPDGKHPLHPRVVAAASDEGALRRPGSPQR